MKRLLILIAFLSGFAYTLPVKAGAQQITTSIEKIRIRDWVTYIKLQGCPRYSRIYLNDEYGKAMYSAALTAAAASKQVTVFFEDTNGCDVEGKLVFLEVNF